MNLPEYAKKNCLILRKYQKIRQLFLILSLSLTCRWYWNFEIA